MLEMDDLIRELESIEDSEDPEDIARADQIEDFLSSVRGYGGDVQWRGNWYPSAFIPDSDFEDYARELAEDIGAIDPSAGWPLSYIDWKAAADALQTDYTSATFEGVDYWYR